MSPMLTWCLKPLGYCPLPLPFLFLSLLGCQTPKLRILQLGIQRLPDLEVMTLGRWQSCSENRFQVPHLFLHHLRGYVPMLSRVYLPHKIHSNLPESAVLQGLGRLGHCLECLMCILVPTLV